MGKLKFSAKKGGDFKLPAEGTYDFEILDWKEEKPTDDGDFRLYLQLKIADGDQAGLEVRDYHTLSSERGWTMRNILQATGVDYHEEDGGEGEPYSIEFDPDELIGRYFRADLTHYHNEKTKKTYPNFSEVQVSPLQEAAMGLEGGENGAGENGSSEEAHTEEKPKPAPAAKAAPAGTARPRPRPAGA